MNKELEERAIELISYCHNDEKAPNNHQPDLRTLINQGSFQNIFRGENI